MGRVDQEDTTTEMTDRSETVNMLGIPDLNRVDQLARALINLSGLSVTNDKARNIQQLYQQLHEYDKKPLTFSHHQPSSTQRGRFERSKRGHTTIDQMKRLL